MAIRPLPNQGITNKTINRVAPSFDISPQIQEETRNKIKFLKDKRQEQLMYEQRVQEQLNEIKPEQFWMDVDNQLKDTQSSMIEEAKDIASNAFQQMYTSGKIGSPKHISDINQMWNKIQSFQNEVKTLEGQAKETVELAKKNDDFSEKRTQAHVMGEMGKFIESMKSGERYQPNFSPQVGTLSREEIVGLVSKTAKTAPTRETKLKREVIRGDRTITESTTAEVYAPFYDDDGNLDKNAYLNSMRGVFQSNPRLMQTYTEMAKGSITQDGIESEALNMAKEIYGKEIDENNLTPANLGFALFAADDEVKQRATIKSTGEYKSTEPYEEKESGSGKSYMDWLKGREAIETQRAYYGQDQESLFLSADKDVGVEVNINDAAGININTFASDEKKVASGKFLGFTQSPDGEVLAEVKFDPRADEKGQGYVDIKISKDVVNESMDDNGNVDEGELRKKINANIQAGLGKGRQSLGEISKGEEGYSLRIEPGTVFLFDPNKVPGLPSKYLESIPAIKDKFNQYKSSNDSGDIKWDVKGNEFSLNKAMEMDAYKDYSREELREVLDSKYNRID